MPTTTISNNRIATGDALWSSTTDDDYEIAQGVLVMSTMNQDGVELNGSNHDLIVRGTVVGSMGVQMGDEIAVDGGNTLTVEASGQVIGSDYAVRLWGGATLTNHGTLKGHAFGVYHAITGSLGAKIVNTGLIEGDSFGIYIGGGGLNGGSVSSLLNEGIIRAKFRAYQGLAETDQLTNKGLLDGGVALGSGDDLFDNRGGTVLGAIYGEEESDRFVLGAAAETVDGGSGIDTLDFRSSTGLRVSLSDADGGANTGRAKDDIYTTIERLWGSSTGADTLIGNGQANTLAGFGGNDDLRGLGGNDQLIGGAGQDTLRGGAGGDAFEFVTSSHGGDAILDFSQADDHFAINPSGFGGGLSAGMAVTDAQFDAQATNVAKTSAVRFIWETDATRLWFDRNGNVDGGLTLVADLQAGATLTKDDILLV